MQQLTPSYLLDEFMGWSWRFWLSDLVEKHLKYEVERCLTAHKGREFTKEV